MTKKIEIKAAPRRKFEYLAVDEFQFEADWTGEDGREYTIGLHACEVVELLHLHADLGHEYVTTTHDGLGNYRVAVLEGDVQKVYDLPTYTAKYASKYSHVLIPVLEGIVVEDIVLLQEQA